MKNLKQMSINMLCELGKYGVKKSLTLGMYEFDVPDSLKKAMNHSCDNNNCNELDIKIQNIKY